MYPINMYRSIVLETALKRYYKHLTNLKGYLESILSKVYTIDQSILSCLELLY